MSIQKRAISILLVFVIYAVAVNLPRWIISYVPTAEVIMPVTMRHTPTITCDGTLYAKNIFEKYTSIPLMIDEVYVKEGDRVEKGDILAKINSSASSSLSSVSANNIQTSQNEIEQYIALAKKYGLEQEAANLIELGKTNYGGNSNQSIQALDEYITAESSGLVLSFSPKKGQLLSSGSLIYSLQTDHCFLAKLEVQESDISNVSCKDKVIVTGEGLGNSQFYAAITDISPVAKQVLSGLQKNTIVDVTAEFYSEDTKLKPGLSVKGKIATEEPTVMISVPYEAIQQDNNNREYVLQFIDGAAIKKYIDVEKELLDGVQIAGGLEENTPVFLQNNSISTNSRYRIILREDIHG